MHNGRYDCEERCYSHCSRYYRCDDDLKVYFKNKIGTTCTAGWLSYQARHNNDVYNAFSVRGGWDCFNWDSVGCVAGNGFEVPNKVKYVNTRYTFL